MNRETKSDRSGCVRAALILAMAASAPGCALSGRPPSSSAAGPTAASTSAQLIWSALAAGDESRARATLAGGAATHGDPVARLADASLAFESGDSPHALEGYLALLESVAGARTGEAAVDRPSTSDMAALAAGRVATLLDEHPGPEPARRAVEDRVLSLAPDGLAWPARYALAMLDERIGLRRGEAAVLAETAERMGCVRALSRGASIGRLPHLDLDERIGNRPASPEDAAGLRAFHPPGCRAALTSFEGRAGAERVFATVNVPREGAYDVVLDYRGEARVIVDGSGARHHGDEHLHGPRISGTRVSWGPGRHTIELRLASYGGHYELTLMVVPAEGSSEASRPLKDSKTLEGAPAVAYTGAYVAQLVGDVAGAEAAARTLHQSPRFALGAVLSAMLARDDPSQPAGFARERARVLLREGLEASPGLARARNALAALALDDDRPHEALEEARRASEAAPRWWLPSLTLYGAYRLRGLEWDGDRALDRAVELGGGACSVVVTALGRAESRREAAVVERREAEAAVACGAINADRLERLRRRGRLDEAEALVRRAIALEPDPSEWRRELGRLLMAKGRAREAAALFEADLEPNDGEGLAEWVDAAIAAGDGARARAHVAGVLERRPDLSQVVRVARALGLPLPLDAHRLDGRKVIAAFDESKRKYASPAVVILDRSVTRVLPSGAELTLTHEIVRVQSKDAIEKWGEISVPDGAEVLTLRTHKPDGTTREPEEVAGKDAISISDLDIGDTVEKETLEVRGPQAAFQGLAHDGGNGFLGDRFYFQSFDAPLDRSEYLLITDAGTARALHVDARAGAPAPTVTQSNSGGRLTVTTFAAHQVPQLFAERSSGPAIDYVPSVRASYATSWPAWTRFLREQLYGTARDGDVLDQAEAEIRAQAGGADATAAAQAAALVAWVGENVEAADELRGAATHAVASGRGNRVAVVLALARRLGLPADVVLGRSRFTAEGAVATPTEEADDFAEVLVRLSLPGQRVVLVDPRLKHAPLGYLSPGLDGARVVSLRDTKFEVVHSEGAEGRAVSLSARLGADGRARVRALEVLRGWPALEWAEVVDRVGGDDTKLRLDFEQRWLGVHFPGADLEDLSVEVAPKAAGDAAGRPYSATEVRLRYAFSSPRFAVPDASGALRIAPLFFRAQPGRRYATEARRSTELLTSFDVPTTVQARIELPLGAHLATSTAVDRIVTRAGQYRFREQRRLHSAPGQAPVLTLEREARLPILRVAPERYPGVAEDLRRVDALEREDIAIVLGQTAGAAR